MGYDISGNATPNKGNNSAVTYSGNAPFLPLQAEKWSTARSPINPAGHSSTKPLRRQHPSFLFTCMPRNLRGRETSVWEDMPHPHGETVVGTENLNGHRHVVQFYGRDE